MPVAEFPLPSVSSSNPTPLHYERLPEGFRVERTIYDDEGADYKLQVGGAGLRTFRLEYNGLSAAAAQILDDHLTTAFFSEDEGSAYGFNFRHHVAGTVWTDTSGTLYSNVHYRSYEMSHTKTWICKRVIVLEQRP